MKLQSAKNKLQMAFSVDRDEEFAFELQRQELALLNDSHIARNIQEQGDDSIMIVDDDENEANDDTETATDEVVGNAEETANDEELARQLQQQFNAELRQEHNRRRCRCNAAADPGSRRVASVANSESRHVANPGTRTRVHLHRNAARPRSVNDDDPFGALFGVMPNVHRVQRNVLVNPYGVFVNGVPVEHGVDMGDVGRMTRSVIVNGSGVFINGAQVDDTDDYEDLWDLAEWNGDVGNRGLNTDEINVLPTSKFTEKTQSASSLSDCGTASDETVNECRICLSQFESNDTLRTLPCLHRFHRDCIDNWIQRNAVCPVCRVKLRDQIGGEN